MSLRPASPHRLALAAFTLALALPLPLLMAPAPGPSIIVPPGGSIQDAVEDASPGDTIFVLPGTYTGPAGADSVVDVQKSGITIVGTPKAVIDASGFEYGIMVGPDAPIAPAGCPPIAVTDFHLKGLTIRDADDTGVRLVAVDGFSLNGSRYIDNYEYGPFPVCSKNGEIRGNFASGSNDAALYVGDDQGVDVIDNVVTDSVAGIEIENSVDSVVRSNLLTGNTGGILTFVLAGLPQPFTDQVLIEDNLIFDNNRTNTGMGAVATVPEGTGILVIGADDVTVRRNFVVANDSFGIGIIGNPFVFLDPRIEPFVDDLVVEENAFLGNGRDPDPQRSFTPGADIIFLPDALDTDSGALLLSDPAPADNCFEDNVFETEFVSVDVLPGATLADFPCP